MKSPVGSMIMVLGLLRLLVPAMAVPVPQPNSESSYGLFATTNLAAWRIVPFDAQKRDPEARAEMLERLGLRMLAYDYRAEHISTFDAEMEALKRHGIRLLAWWFPATLNEEARLILEVLKRHQLPAQLWVSGGGEPTVALEDWRLRVESEAKRIRPIAEAAAEIGCSVALYNHGGWFGEPENQIAIVEQLKQQGVTNVGLVYNLHHGQEHLDRFPELLAKMKPCLVALNLNGIARRGDPLDKKILPLGQGDLDLQLLRTIRESGWQGPLGILNHTDHDAEARLKDNLEGLAWLVKQLDGQPSGSKPQPRTWAETTNAALPENSQPPIAVPRSTEFGNALSGGLVVEAESGAQTLPLTIECWAKLRSHRGFNILAASEPKTSATHWELYSYAGNGGFSVYQPGRGGEFKSGVNICDNRWHYLAAILEDTRVRLFVDGKLALDAPAISVAGQSAPGMLAFGRLVEGGIGCDGLVDEVRISRGARDLKSIPQSPFKSDALTLGHWSFDDIVPAAAQTDQSSNSHSSSIDYWAVEDATEREKLPLYKTIPPARPDELTPANGYPPADAFLTWHRSHGDNYGTRYSGLDQINRQNVTNLQVAWTYHSGDGSGNLQCNPIIANGVMFAPTPGKHMVAINAETGHELWRFKPVDRPAYRGLIYWPGHEGASERLLFCAGPFLYALHPQTGLPVASFGKQGRVKLPGGTQGDFGAATAAPAIFENIIVVPGFEKDVWGFEVTTGQHLWTFHTVPEPGEFGYDTWDRPQQYSANCWGGMAMDEVRGIAYITTGSPKPNFIGVWHQGQNLFANCVVALDARTGKRLWHFQEIAHDIWDLDIPAPPNLTTITRDGRKVDVVAAVTKIGNTLLLDRLTGKPIFPFRLRRAPTSDLPGEQTWPYQPDVELPEPFAKMDFTMDDVTDRTDEAFENIASIAQSATLGWFRPFSQGKMNLYFALHGGAEWTGACVDPQTSRLYVSANHIPWIISVFRDDDPPDDPQAPRTPGQLIFEQTCARCHGTNRVGIGTAPPLRGLRHRLTDEAITNQIRNGKNSMPAHPDLSEADLKSLVDFLMLRDRPLPPAPPQPERPNYSFNGYPKFLDYEGYPANRPPWGTLNCIDLNSGKLLWKVPLGEHEELTAYGFEITGTENFGGAIVTAGGLVFCSGTRDAKIRAFDQDTGAELWSAKLPWTGSAPPATYQVNGQQYVVIAATGGGKLGTPTGDAYVAFRLAD